MRKGSQILGLLATLFMAVMSQHEKPLIEMLDESETFVSEMQGVAEYVTDMVDRTEERDLQEFIISNGTFETDSGFDCIYNCILQ